MKSTHADYFNHDEDSLTYDQDVISEADPIRKGYAEGLSWLGSQVRPGSTVLDLGAGTGNTVAALPGSCLVVAVDVSSKMLAIAKQKLRGRTVRFVLADILEFFDIQQGQFDYVVSSYAIHHLTDGEKDHLFSCVRAAISPGGKAVFVDLMYRNLADRNRLMDQFRQTDPDVVEGFQEEFFWNLDLALDQLKHHGFDSTQKRFSDLSWGLLAIPVAGEEARGK